MRELGGPPCVYVGHPLIERLAELRPNADEAQRRRAEPPVVLVLPGSRSSEIRRLLGDVRRRRSRGSAARAGPMELVLPTDAASLPRRSAPASPAGRSKPRIVVEPAEKWAAFRTARAALAASGTVTLELALAGVPTVAAYRVTADRGDHRAGRARIEQRLPSVILANLVLGENVVPEFLQRDCTPQRLAEALVPLLVRHAGAAAPDRGLCAARRIMALENGAERQAAAVVLDAARTGRAPHLLPPPRRVNCLFAATRLSPYLPSCYRSSHARSDYPYGPRGE